MISVKPLHIVEHSSEESLTVGKAGWLYMSADTDSMLSELYKRQMHFWNPEYFSQQANRHLLPWAFLLAKDKNY